MALRCLTFEVRRDRRQDARPGLGKRYAYHQPGPGGLPLGLASTEGIGLTGGQGAGVQVTWTKFVVELALEGHANLLSDSC